ncbi:YdaU family protein [Sphingomonas soli]|uniref:YdaU family protein n=1 Tax=Sphingomonas soli TaxID=266127 RepID=UPI00082E3628|nr:YdaU family protein [Sphingomonas soli]
MSARWYKRCGADFIHGTMMLTLEEKGAYSLCLDLIYDRGAPIPDDARWLSGVCGVSIRKWNSIRDRLLDLGKIYAENGLLSNARADFELVSTELSSRERAESGAKGGRKRAENAGQPLKNNNIAQAEPKREEKIREEVEVVEATPLPVVSALPALQVWNDACAATGWAQVKKFTPTRQAALRARIRDDGMDGWTAAIARAVASPLLTAQPPPTWFDFDFIVKSGNFAKLIEGKYDRQFSRNGSDDRPELGRTNAAAISVFGQPQRQNTEPDFEALRRVGPDRGAEAVAIGQR